MHNALGFAYFNMSKTDMAIAEYKQAVEKQPGCESFLQITAHNCHPKASHNESASQDASCRTSQAVSHPALIFVYVHCAGM